MVALILEVVTVLLVVEEELGKWVMMGVMTCMAVQLLFLLWEVQVGLLIGQVQLFTMVLVEEVHGILLEGLTLGQLVVED
jgi:hypothetical protein